MKLDVEIKSLPITRLRPWSKLLFPSEQSIELRSNVGHHVVYLRMVPISHEFIDMKMKQFSSPASVC